MEFPFSVNDVFSKKFTLYRKHEYILPDVNEVFTSEPWRDDRFEYLKTYLNKQKSRLDNYDLNVWQQHTYKTNLAKDVSRNLKFTVKPELLTVAWTKFYECACNYNLIPRKVNIKKILNSLHLCEAPGAFIASLNHYLKLKHKKLQWNWKASTLNPYYEGNCTSSMIDDDRFIKNTLDHWDFGSDYTGNIMDWNNSQSIIKNTLEMGEIHLVTADGSIDCSTKPEDQEAVVASLHFCEVITALQVLCRGGSFILKMFTIYEHSSINLLYLLINCFRNVDFFKPVTSKHGNSEIYVICLDYLGSSKIDKHLKKFKEYYGSDEFLTKAIFPKNCIPQVFFESLLEISIFFFEFQYIAIDLNIYIFEHPHLEDENFRKVRSFQKSVVNNFMKKTGLKSISDSDKICAEYGFSETNKAFFRHGEQFGTFSERVNSEYKLTLDKLLRYRDAIFKFRKYFRNLPFTIDCHLLDNIPLNFVYGSSYKEINSSKFVFTHIFKIYHELQDKNSKNSLKFYVGDDDLIVEADVAEFENSETTILNGLRRSLMSMNENDVLTLCNFKILTQFRAGLLYKLSVMGFEKIVFSEDLTIKLCRFKNKIETISFIEKLCEEPQISQTSDGSDNITLLGIAPLKHLLMEPFYSNVCDFNNHVLFNEVNLKINLIIGD